VGTQVGAAVNAGVFEDSVEPTAKEGLVDFIDGVEEIGDGLRLVPSPGHTPGQKRKGIADGDSRGLYFWRDLALLDAYLGSE